MKIYFSFLVAIFFVCQAAWADCCCCWPGFYAGVNVGGAFGHSHARTSIPRTDVLSYFGGTDFGQVESVGNQHLRPSGFTGGVQAGFNYCLCNNILAGLETDFGALLLSDSDSKSVRYLSVPESTLTMQQKISTDWLYTLRLRLGWVCNRWLPFITGGLAVTNFRYKQVFLMTSMLFSSPLCQVLLRRFQKRELL